LWLRISQQTIFSTPPATDTSNPLRFCFSTNTEVSPGQAVQFDIEQGTLARKIAAITLIIWKKGASFDPKQLQRQAA